MILACPPDPSLPVQASSRPSSPPNKHQAEPEHFPPNKTYSINSFPRPPPRPNSLVSCGLSHQSQPRPAVLISDCCVTQIGATRRPFHIHPCVSRGLNGYFVGVWRSTKQPFPPEFAANHRVAVLRLVDIFARLRNISSYTNFARQTSCVVVACFGLALASPCIQTSSAAFVSGSWLTILA